MNALGRHILVDFTGCTSDTLNNVAHLEQCMVDAARQAGATVINTSFHHFSPYGVSGVVVIQESHLAVHTWPEYGFAAIDLFTCGETLDPWVAYTALKTSLGATAGHTQELSRGNLNQLARINTLPSTAPSAPPIQARRNIWHTTKNRDIALSLRHAGSLFKKQSDFQTVEVLDTYGYGRMLVLDGTVVCSEKDEAVYHEMLVHIPALTHPNLRRALVIGGGDGGAARELLRHPSLEKATLVEIDQTVVDASRRFFPHMAPALDDPRISLIFQDGINYIGTCPDASFDLILIDAAHPDGPAEALFSQAFYREIRRCLAPGGILCARTEPPALYAQTFRNMHQNQRTIFGAPHVHCYLAFIPTYTTGLLSFSYASTGSPHPLQDFDPNRAAEFTKHHTLCYYNADIHQAAFSLPTFLTDLLDARPEPGDPL